MQRLLSALLALAVVASASLVSAQPAPHRQERAPAEATIIPLSDNWRMDGDRVTIARQFASGRRQFADTQTIDLSRPDNIIPVPLWPDNRHLGAYMGGDKTRRIRAEWLDGGRLLRLNIDVSLTTQQGDRAVNILSDYKVSANGSRLTLTELRSTRNRPVVYTFTRAK